MDSVSTLFPAGEYHSKGKKAYKAGRPCTVQEARADMAAWLNQNPRLTGNILVQFWMNGWKEAEKESGSK